MPVGFIVASAATAGLFVWPGFVYAYVRTRHRPWAWCAAAYLVPALALVVWRAGGPEHGSTDDLLTAASFVLGGIGAVHLASIRQSFTWRHAARLREEERARARSLCRADPAPARLLGIGRPDLPGAADAGLIDINHASREVIERIQGVTPEQAARIEELRSQGLGFTSLEDMDLALDLPLAVLQQLRNVAVFVPRD